MTQEDIAEKVEMDQSQISRLERQGGADARVSPIRRCVEALGGEIHIVATFRGKIVRLRSEMTPTR